MKRFNFLIAFLLLANVVFAQQGEVEGVHYLGKTVIVKLKKEHASRGVNDGFFQKVLNDLKATPLVKKFPGKEAPAEARSKEGFELADLSRIYTIQYSSEISVLKAIKQLKVLDAVEYAEPHYIQESFFTPNDPMVSSLYHLTKIKAFEGWDISKGDTNIIIGITDSGIDLLHEDLSNNIKKNYLDPIDGIDNDLDGYIDNFYGWDLGEKDNNPSSTNHHGVHVSGLASAVTNNAKGVAGVGFSTKLMPIKVSNAPGFFSAAYEGIVYAADHGCHIINCSWGNLTYSEFGQDVINYATINQGALVVAAAGNKGNETVYYPASYKNVLSVAGTDVNDNRFVVHATFGSNYGINIDVAAPGRDILSTWANNQYNYSSGTSMAAPIVSGAAAIVKAKFPHLSGLQVGEQLKVTADNIDSLNPGAVQRMGAGRINLYRALTEINRPSIVLKEKSLSDNNDELLNGEDTLRITGKFINYLAASGSVNATLTSSSPYVEILSGSINLGSFQTLEIKANDQNPFIVKILNSVPVNLNLVFKVEYSAPGYSAFEFFEIMVNQDFINISTPRISSTINSNGRVGFNKYDQKEGLGLVYKGHNLIYESGLMIGNSISKVSDVVRAIPSSADNDFTAVERVKEIPSEGLFQKVQAGFNDNGAGADALKIEIKQHTITYDSIGHYKYFIQELTITNNNPDSLKNLYAGYFTDWDIQSSFFNEANSDLSKSFGYAFSKDPFGLYGGVKVLSSTAPVNIYSINNAAGGVGGVDISNGFESFEKYITLSTSRLRAGENGADVSQVVSTGPFKIAPLGSVKVAFAFMAGDNLLDLQTSAKNAQQLYNSLYQVVGVPDKENNLSDVNVFPNPSSDKIVIETGFDFNLKIYNVSGGLVYDVKSKGNTTVDVSSFIPGLYFIKVSGAKGESSIKRVIIGL